jgi:hypothetical protein
MHYTEVLDVIEAPALQAVALRWVATGRHRRVGDLDPEPLTPPEVTLELRLIAILCHFESPPVALGVTPPVAQRAAEEDKKHARLARKKVPRV